MICKELTIANRLGLHARAASHLVMTASGFRSRITIERDGARADAKSIMGIMLLAAAKGQKVSVCAEGEDEVAALTAIEALIRNRFHEEQ